METRRLLRFEDAVWMKHKLLPYLSEEDKVNIIPSGNSFIFCIRYGKIKPKCSHDFRLNILLK